MEESIVIEARHLKQTYLKENIIQAGYDAEAFVKFMADQRPNGENIEVWTYEDLIDVVQEFKHQINNETEIYYEDDQILYESMEPVNDQQQNEELDITEFEPQNQGFEKVSEMNKKTVVGGNVKTTVKITKEEKESTGMFSSDVFYTIETNPIGFKVRRTSDNFMWLRRQMIELYPGAYVPPCESEKDKKIFLQRFLNSILERRELRNLPIFEEFLSLEKQETNYKEKDLKCLKPKLPDLKTLQGNNINIYTMKEYKKLCQDNLLEGVTDTKKIDFVNFSSNLSELVDENVPLFSKIKYAANDLKKAFTEGSEALFKMSSLQKKVMHNKSQFIKTSKLNPDQDTDQILKVLKTGLEGWGTHLLTMNSFITDNISSYFHFAKHELSSLNELGKLRDQCMETFKNSKNDQYSKKMKLFEERKVEKWGCPTDSFVEPVKDVQSNLKIAIKYILPKETEVQKKMKCTVEFVCFQQIAEYLLFRKRYNRKFIENFTKFGQKVKDSVIDNKDVLWNNVEAFKNSKDGFQIISQVGT